MRHSLLIGALLGSAAFTAGCGGATETRATSGGGAAGPGNATSAGAAALRFADYDGGAVPGGPGAGKRYGLGSAANATAISRMDTDIGPDCAELPAGKGTAAEGGALYKAQCAMCHGAKGEGMAPAFPQLSGRDPKAEGFKFSSDPKLPHTIGNYWSHATTLFDYIKRAMPHTAPGSLTNDQVYALSAYLLAVDDVIPDDATLDAASLRAIKMPYADRFVPDDRRPNATK